MTLYDISLTYSKNLPIWPGDPEIELKQISSIQDGELANVTHLSMCVHAGTHVDAPDHFLGNDQTVEDIPIDLMVGPAAVIKITTDKTITKEDLDDIDFPVKIKRILFKTTNSDFWKAGIKEFQEGFIGLSPEAAAYLVELGIEVLGVDYLSVAPYYDPAPTHKILLEAGVLIIEGLDLSRVEPGEYTLICPPLKISGSDGAPARVLLQT
jgi:arylformamidase